MKVIEKVREKQPLIHHLTNEVVINFTANGLLAFGGSPIMAKEVEEMKEMASIADGVFMNIGTLLKSELEAMIVAGKTANQRGIPVVLDPVGVAATHFRHHAVQTLLQEVNFSAIKGNAGEMAHLVDVAWKTKGVESIDEDISKLENIAKQVAKKYNTIAIVTGELDVICEGENVKTNKTGHELLTKVTGAGCLLGSIVTACMAVVKEDELAAVYDGVSFYGRAAELAAHHNDVHGSGTFLPYFIDALGTNLDAEETL